MNIYKISQLLEKTYSPSNVDLSLNETREDYLSESIIPSDTFVFSGKGATLQTTKGELIDLASMTVNCILGQNDPWVNANMIAYLLSGRPSFLTTRLGSEFYYKVAKRIFSHKLPLVMHSEGKRKSVSVYILPFNINVSLAKAARGDTIKNKTIKKPMKIGIKLFTIYS